MVISENDEWFARSVDDTEEAAIRRVGDHAFEARIWKRATGPAPVDTVLAHGPRVFPSMADARSYVDANMAPWKKPWVPTEGDDRFASE
jgi:hypothetical protein